MAQRKAQGSLTIIDTNDIERIYVVYAKHTSNTDPSGLPAAANWKETIATAPGSGDYIWQRTVIKKTGTSELSYSDPVCVTGPEGDAAKNIIAIETQYGTSADWNTQPSSWSNDTPNYDSSKPNYWTRTRLKYEDNTYSSWVVNKDYALTKAVENSVLANSIAQSANENAQGAMSQAAANIQTITRIWYAKADSTAPAVPTSHVTTSSATTYNAWNIKRPNSNDSYPYYFYCDETCTGGGVYSWSEVTLDTSNLSQYQIGTLTAQVKNFWWDSSGAHVASGKNGNEVTKGTISTYGYHALMGLTGINFNYDGAKVVELNSTTPSLDFYQPPTISSSTVTQGKKTMMLSANALRFYNPSDGTTEQAVLDTNGLVLKRGGIEAGSKNTTDYIYVWSYDDATNHNLSINNSGNKSDWRIVAGNKFGVDKAGNLYASNVEISGKIAATSLTIGSGATVSGLSTSNISGIDNYALQSSLDTEVAQRKAVYAVSTTGATAAAKTTESGTPSGFVLYNGATVTVKFNNANSTTTPTLNVNETGAKTIKSYTGAALTAAEYTWPAGAAITFTYDGSYWRMQDSGALQAKADAAASASSASSSASAASSSASSASTSASNASSSATSASNSASTASTKATEASNSASTASSKASAASTSATNAANSASAANTSATNASNSADAAASSASDASDSADAAAGSASTASSKATAASNSATAASNSASSASSSATAASNSASSASSSATTATNKANAASESATNAANSATAASGSATAASNSATAASDSATAASNSATAASNSATAAAEVMGGFTILWNYSAFGTATAGDAFICGFDPATGTKSDGNGWVKWNSTKRTITKQQVNPGTIVPYNIPIYIVCRLSSATATTGTNYMVWYNAGWKYAACPSPTTVGGSWTWTDNRDIILGSFVETGANEALTECELFNPPWTSKQITTNTTTSTSYIMDVDSNRGITVKPKDSSGNDFLQMNSTAIEFFRNSTTASVMRLTDNSLRLGLEASNHTTIDTNGLHIWAGAESTATNELALFGASGAQIGSDDLMHVSIDADSFTMTDANDTEIAHIGSPSSSTVTDTFYYDGAGFYIFELSQTPTGTTVVEINGTATRDFTRNGKKISIFFSVSLVKGDIITATYETEDNIIFYTFGGRSGNAGRYSMAEGATTTASGAYSHAEGVLTQAVGRDSHAEGNATKAYGFASHAEGMSSKSTSHYAHAEGYFTGANGEGSHSEGTGTKADGNASHAEGMNSIATGIYSHAEGMGTTAYGDYSHSEGRETQARGNSSHAQNLQTMAYYEAQTTIGKYNDNQADSAFEIGNGTSDTARSNALTIDWNGNLDLPTGKFNGVGLDLSYDSTNSNTNAIAVTNSSTNILTVDWNGGFKLHLDVDSSASSSTAATSGTDKDLFNKIRALGWYSDVIS